MALKGKPRDMKKWREVLLDPNVHFPGESSEYRRARNELLEAEAELRRLNEQVAAQRRALPAGGLIREDYIFESAADGSKVRFSELFAPGKNSLVIYNMMFPRWSEDPRAGAPGGKTAELPLVEHPPERLREVEFLPFKAAIEAGVATIMTAHVFVPSLDEKRPATLSRRVVTDLLRDELKFEGVILSDDLEMKAIAAEYPAPRAAVLAIEAGCDGALICSGDHDTQAAALEAIVHAVEDDRLGLSRVEEALRRQQRAKERFLAAPVAVKPMAGRALRDALGRDEHRAVAEEMARFL